MLKRIGAEESGEFKAVASGTLPSGQPVVVNADGTVSVAGLSTLTQGVGSATVYESASSTSNLGVYDPGNDKVIIGYTDGGNSTRGTAVVGTVSGQSISFGTPVEMGTGNSAGALNGAFDVNAGSVIFTFEDNSNGGYGTAIVGQVSGTSISFGSKTVFKSSSCHRTAVAYDENAQKCVIVYRDAGASGRPSKAKVATISGTSVSFGSEASVSSGNNNASVEDITYDASAQKVVAIWTNYSSGSAGCAAVGTVSGTSISFGNQVTYESGTTSGAQKIVYDASAQKVLIAYKDDGDSDKGKCIVGTVSGTNISFGSIVVFDDSDLELRGITLAYDTNASKTVLSYIETGTSPNSGKNVPVTISGTTPSIGTATNFSSFDMQHIGSVYDPDQKKVVVVYADHGGTDTYHGTAKVFQNATAETNLTSENYIGMSRGVAFQTGSADSVGSETQFIASMGNEISAGVYDPDSSKVILAYSDSDNSTRGTAVVGTVSGTSISFGTPAVYNSGTTNHIGITYDTTNNKVVIVYDDAGNSGYGTAVVGTVSGTSISFGSEVVYNTASSHNNNAAFDTNTGKVVIAFSDDSNNDVISRVGTVSGTSISFGTAVQVADSGGYVKIVFDSNSNKVVVVFRDEANSNYGTARVGTVSGTDISFGTAAVWVSSSAEDVQATFDSTNNKIVIGYKDGGDSDKGKAFVGTVSGTNISFGSAATFNTGGSFGMNGVIYNSNQNKVFLFFKSSAIGKVVSGTVSGTTVGSLSSDFTYHNASTGVPFQVYDVASTNIVAAYRDGADSKGKAVVFKPDNIATTRGEVASGQAASMDIIGSVSDNQIGLTAGQQYFVQTDGTIGTTAATPSVLAGTAISATELLVKT